MQSNTYEHIKIDSMKKYKQEFMEMLQPNNYLNIISSKDNIIITDNTYEKVIKPYKEWILKRRLIGLPTPFAVLFRNMQSISEDSTDIELILGYKIEEDNNKLSQRLNIIIPKSFNNIHLTFRSTLHLQTVITTIESFDSISKSPESIGEIMQSLVGLIIMKNNEYLKLEKCLLDVLNTLIDRTESLIKAQHASISDKQDIMSIYRTYAFRYTNNLIIRHLESINKAKDGDNESLMNLFDKLEIYSIDNILDKIEELNTEILLGVINMNNSVKSLKPLKHLLIHLKSIYQHLIQEDLTLEHIREANKLI